MGFGGSFPAHVEAGRTAAVAFFTVAVVVFAAALFGIFTRPVGQLAAFWPANAIFLGVLVRFPALATPWGWLGGVAALLAADFATGGALLPTLLLTAANLVGIAAGFIAFSSIEPPHRRLVGPRSILHVGWAILIASGATGLAGAVVNPILFDGTALDGLYLWGVTELVNYVAILPVVLTLPARGQFPSGRLRSAVPFAALLVSLVVAAFVDGPGALAFPLPALLWCALTYTPFTTALVTLLSSAATLLAISTGVLSLETGVMSASEIISVRLGVSLMAIGPLVVAGTMMAHRTLHGRLQDLADRDQLTGALSRRAFLERATETLGAGTHAEENGAAILMIDLDHFKRTNDTHGHAAGDLVLQAFARIVQRTIRSGDVFGRWGGEEFAVALPACSPATAEMVAERVRAAVAAEPVALDHGRTIRATVSIGVATEAAPARVECLLERADRALYEAKRRGRDRIALADAAAPDPST